MNEDGNTSKKAEKSSWLIPSSNINDTDSSSIIQTHIIYDSILSSAQKKLWRALTFSSGTQIFLSMTNWNESVFEGIDSQNDPCYASRDVVLKGSDPQTIGWTRFSSKYCVGRWMLYLHAFVSGSNASCKCFSASSFSSLDRLECSSVKWISPHIFYTRCILFLSIEDLKTTLKDINEPKTLRLALHVLQFQDQHLLLWLQTTNPGTVWNSGHASISQYLNISENVKIYLNVSMSLCLYFHVYKHHDYGMPKIVISKTVGFMWMSQTCGSNPKECEHKLNYRDTKNQLSIDFD